ncbi:S-adenosyl-L-methionine-dependent methyltransferase [Polyplosphaeria fusca]|uniref:S-adenosyl-L-methionine-dependent methyltransferase n=1 Tax=Polyplosphaeria fusca TaxID=682080 RepID=A0A9P4QN49_9PLEO|nr:S-adenosyl-L-methionine-dependent methyltransferase [Polyplosphaeria fusca]
MPRIPTSLLRQARKLDALLPPLLAPCRDLGAAQNELRWLREHVDKVASTRGHREQDTLLRNFVQQRASGKPLQYILGTEYFGPVEIRCRPGVLIPRQDTAASVTHVAQLIGRAQSLPSELRVLDLCTGTGCIPLLFDDVFTSTRRDVPLRCLGVDISEKAIELAGHNVMRVQREKKDTTTSTIELVRADVLVDPFAEQAIDVPSLKAALNMYRLPPFWDMLISNPPYVSPSAYWKTTTSSVRHFEPRIALVPPAGKGQDDTQQGDAFYQRLITVARDVEARVVLLEVADVDQAVRVARMAKDMQMFDGIEIWRDEPDQCSDQEPTEQDGFAIVGRGNGRSVLCWRERGGLWLGKTPAWESDADRLSETYRSMPRLTSKYSF